MGRMNRSVKLLDQIYGIGWPFRIKLKEFDMNDAYHCVLGQLSGHYWKAIDCLSEHYTGVDEEPYAFNYDFGRKADLNQKWKKRIKKLRKERKELWQELFQTGT